MTPHSFLLSKAAASAFLGAATAQAASRVAVAAVSTKAWEDFLWATYNALRAAAASAVTPTACPSR